MNDQTSQQGRLLYPPGGILLWIIIYLELLTFAAALAIFVMRGLSQVELFHQSRMQLNTTVGTINVFVLLLSGYFLANAMTLLRAGFFDRARRAMLFCMSGGVVFLGLKSAEYAQKLSHGLHMSSNEFFTFYWMLTGFHALHVVVGLLMLWRLRRQIGPRQSAESLENLEAGAAFWHMCDLIWLLLFPILYLAF